MTPAIRAANGAARAQPTTHNHTQNHNQIHKHIHKHTHTHMPTAPTAMRAREVRYTTRPGAQCLSSARKARSCSTSYQGASLIPGCPSQCLSHPSQARRWLGAVSLCCGVGTFCDNLSITFLLLYGSTVCRIVHTSSNGGTAVQSDAVVRKNGAQVPDIDVWHAPF